MEKIPPHEPHMDFSRPTTPHDDRDVLTDLPGAKIMASPTRNRIHRRPVDEEEDITNQDAGSIMAPPSFAQSEFETIIRRQRNNQPHNLKVMNIPSRYPNLDNNWEFAGWGSMSYVELTPDDLNTAAERLSRKPVLIGQLCASSIAGNGMTGSVFYAIPAVAAAASIFSPIAMLTACLLLFLFRPILLELGSAVRLNGANYIYLLQFSGKTMGLVGAAATLLDAVAMSSVSAATATAYLSGEFESVLTGFREPALAIGIITLLCVIGLFNLRESSTLALSFTIFHLLVMATLMVTSIVALARTGSSVLVSNWAARPSGTAEVARSIFNGICIAFLGVTGFECTPAYIENIRPREYPSVIRNLLYTTIFLNAPLMVFVYALIPSETILGGANVLSVLAEITAGRWLRIIIVIDCVLVVGGGGVFGGLVMMCGLMEKIARDRIIPKAFLRTLPSGSPYVSISFFFVLATLMYASSGFALSTISWVFSVAFLFVLMLFSISSILLKFNRNRLPREHRASLKVSILALAVITVVLIGNIVGDPKIIGLFLTYFIVVFLSLLVLKSQIKLARLAMWIFDQAKILHRWNYTKNWDDVIIRWMRGLRTHPICVWVRTDDIYNLVEAILYVRRNEPTAKIIFIHAYDDVLVIPSELEANVKILDEAFPAITIDLVFMKGRFNPTLVDAASHKLDIPKSQMFMNTMGKDHGWELADYGGVRVVNL